MEKLAVIVPYRDRKEHLSLFVPHMEKCLSEDGVDFNIFIIEQDNDKPFNRAKLLNVGFDLSKEFDYFAFHDVDMLPVDSDYSPIEGPTHLASEVEQFSWGLPYEGYFGGVTLFDKESFLKINGYSNDYWGWGAEDDDVLHRCMLMGVETYRKECRYRSLNHERVVERNLYHQNVMRLKDFQSDESAITKIQEDGLSTLSYTKKSQENITDLSRLIKVDI